MKIYWYFMFYLAVCIEKNTKASISYFYRNNIANFTAEPTFLSWYKRVQ